MRVLKSCLQGPFCRRGQWAVASANLIRRYRLECGEMTQKQLVELIGVSRQTINAIEGGKYPPSMEVAFRIANILCTSIENVFFYEPDFEGDDEFAAGLVIEAPLDGDDRDVGN